MNSKFTRTALAVAGLAAVFISAIAYGRAQSAAPAPSTATAASPHAAPTQPANGATDAKTAEQVFKNIQVLKGIPADQLQPAMQFIAASLGVECAFCHTQGAFDNDDKKPKLAARKMIQMQMAINKESFEGHTAVTCNSCHRGSHDPVAIPVISDEEPKPAPAEGANAAPRPTADQILDKYIQAVGGAEALQKVSSRVEKGTVTIRDRKLPIEVFAKAPDKRFTVSHGPNGDSVTATDGHIGWLANGDRPPQEMSEADNNVFKLDAAFRLPTDLKQIFTQLRVGRPDKIADKEVNQLIGIRQGQPPVRLFFDAQSGLLVRMLRYTETPLGRNPAQIDYADYRDSGGVKIPYQWTVARPAGRFTIKVDQVQQNVPIDDAKFVKPATPPSPPPATQPKP